LFRYGRKGVGVGKVNHYFPAVGVNLAIVIARFGVFAVARSVFGKKIQNIVVFSPDKVDVHASAFGREAAVTAFQPRNAGVAVFKTEIQLRAKTAFYNRVAFVRVDGEKLLVTSLQSIASALQEASAFEKHASVTAASALLALIRKSP